MSAGRKASTGTLILLSGFFLALALALCSIAGFWILREEELGESRRTMHRLALALAEQTVLAIQEIDGILKDVRPLLETAPHAPPELVHRRLRSRFHGHLQGQTLAVIGADGRLLALSGEFPTPDITVADREYFRTHAESREDALHIAAPLRNRFDGSWIISLSRRLSGPDGAFAGIVMAAIEMDYFARPHRALELPPETRILLRRDDGVALSVHPFDEALLMTPLPASLPAEGAVDAASPVNGLPLSVCLTTPQEALLRPWRRVAWLVGPGDLAAVAGIMALSWALARRVRRESLRSQEEQRRLEDQVQERSIDLDAVRSLNETILAASPVGIAVYRQEGRCVSINAVCSRILGHAGPPPALEADPFWRRTGLPARARKPLETGGMASGECRVGPNDDAPWIDWQTVRFIREGVHHLLLLVTDITERKRAEEQLRRIGAVLTSMLVNLPLDFWARDREGRLIIQSDISRAVWGDQRGMGETVPTVDFAVTAAWRANNQRALAGEVVENERVCRLPSGETAHLRELVAPIRADGEITGIMGVNVDMTPYRRLERELRATTEAAEAANRSKSEFLANMSHEIRTPLNGILGMLQLLQTTRLDGEQAEYLHAAIGSTRRLTRLLSDILDLSRIEAGKLVLEEAAFAVEALRDALLEVFALAARGKGIALDFHIDARMPPRLVGDEARLRQILFNLVGNALKFTEAGHVRVEAVPLPSPADGPQRVLFSVEDSGRGIPDERLPHIFEPFVQGETIDVRNHQGAGLGLSIVRRLSRLMGGELAIDSREGRGTTVHLSLPLALPGEPERKVRQAEAPQPEAGYRILLVEDEQVNRLAVRRMLEKAGHAVVLAGNGQEALEHLAGGNFDCVLMDIQMPVMDGLTATRAIRDAEARQGLPRIPIIAMTAYAMAGDRERCLAAGMDDYIAKPVEKAALRDVLGRAVTGAGPAILSFALFCVASFYISC